MATTRDRYILDVDVRSATRNVDQLKAKIDQLGGSQTQQRIRQLQQTINGIKFDRLTREVEELKRKLDELARTRADDALDDVGDSARGASGAMSSLRGAIGAVVAVLSVGAFVSWTRSAIDAKRQMDALTNSLATFTGSTASAQREMQRISGLATEMGVRVEDLAGSFTIFSRFGLDTSSEALRAWTNIALATGKSMDQLGEAVADALTGEFERLKEFGIRVSQENGVFTASIAGQQDIVANSTTELIRKLQALGSEGGAWAGGIERNTGTLSGSMNRLSNAVGNASRAFVEGLEPSLIRINNMVADLLSTNEDLARELGQNLGQALETVAQGVRALGDMLGLLQEAMRALGVAFGIAALVKFSGYLLAAAESGTTFAAMLKTIGSFSGAAMLQLPIVGNLIAGISKMVGGLALAFSVTSAAVVTAVGAITAVFLVVDRLMKRAFDISPVEGLVSMLWTVVTGVGPAIVEVLENIADAWNWAGGDLQPLDKILALDDTEEKLAILKRRYEGLVIFGSQEDVDRGREMIRILEEAAAATEQLRLARAKANEAAVIRGQMVNELLAPHERAIELARQFASTDYSTPAQAVTNRVAAAQQTISDLEQAFTDLQAGMAGGRGISEGMANTLWPEYAELVAAARRELEAATAAQTEFFRRGEEGTYARFFNDLMEGAANAQRETQFTTWAIEDLQTAIVNGGTAEELERWRSALEQLTPDSFNSFYQSLVEGAQATVRETGYTQQAIEALGEALRAGAISPEVYREAMRRLNTEMDSEAVRTYQTVLAELNTTFAESQANAAINADAMAQLTEQYSNQVISLEQYRAGIQALGGAFDNYTLRIGDTDAYLNNLRGTVEDSIQIDQRKMDALRQLTAEFQTGSLAPELYRQMVQAMGFEIDATTGRVRALMTEMELLKASADEALASAEARIRAAQEQAELSGYEGVERALRAIILEEERLRDATIERLRAQALANGVSEADLNAQIARIEEQTRATIAARQEAARIEEANRRRFDETRRMIPTPTGPRAGGVTPREPSRTPITDWLDGIFGNNGASGLGTRSNPAYVIPIFQGLDDLFGDLTRRIINQSDLTGNITGVLNSLSSPLAAANRGGGFLGDLFGGFFATGGNLPPGRFGIVGEAGPEVVSGPATITPLQGQQVVYNINAVDVRSFQEMLAQDPSFVHAVVQRAQRRIPGSR